MNTKSSYIFRAAALAGAFIALTGCTEDTYDTVSEAGIPQASDYNIVVKVDQETNQFTLNIDNPVGVYPVWKIYTKANPVISTRDGYSDIIVPAGDYEVEMQVGNRNGISEGVRTATIHIENTKIDFTPYMRNLTDGSSKEWHIDGSAPGHLGCGPAGSEGLEWWSAAPNDKKDWGVYDNKMIFADNGGTQSGLYTYDPGESGTIYVNTGITDLPPYSSSNTNDGQDYCAPAEIQADRRFELVADGADLVMVLPEGTLFGYLPNVEFYNNPRLKVHSISKNKIEVSCTNNDIAWHYILAPFEAAEPVFTGFKYDSEFNMWKNASVSLGSTFFANNDWGGIDQPEVTVTNEKIFFHTPADMGGSQWQGQVHVATDIVLSAEETYDFSIFVNAPVDSKVTVKPHPDGNDNEFLYADIVDFAADGSCFYLSDVSGFDGTLVLTLDFAGNPDTDFEISNIVIKKHSDDDGTVLPSEPDEPEAPVTWVDVNSEDNMFFGCEYTTEFYYAPGWAQIADPEMTADGNSFTLSLPEATTDQWQAQFKLHTNLATSADKAYDFRVTFTSDQSIPGVTYKCVKSGGGDNDNIFYMADRVEVPAYDEVTYKWVNLPGQDIDKLSVVLDFGGNPAGTEVTVKDIIIQEHRD